MRGPCVSGPSNSYGVMVWDWQLRATTKDGKTDLCAAMLLSAFQDFHDHLLDAEDLNPSQKKNCDQFKPVSIQQLREMVHSLWTRGEVIDAGNTLVRLGFLTVIENPTPTKDTDYLFRFEPEAVREWINRTSKETSK
jgi:hypothetical protein